jgi:hypothetical protein
MFIYVKNTSNRKKKKPTAKQREMQASWKKLMKKYEPKNPVDMSKRVGSYALGKTSHRETPYIPSLPFTAGVCTKKEHQMYTGDAMIGIGQLHKSNAVPVFKKEDAVDLAKMRRN